ncbi:MAG: hypothetical protein ACLVJ6_06060 [Merdibacter sp.]
MYTSALSIFSALLPYVTVFFSASILKELATLRREAVLWQWVWLGVISVGVLSMLKALLGQRFETLTDDLWQRKDCCLCTSCSHWIMPTLINGDA